MNHSVPSKEEMRLLVSKIYETSNKLKGNIEIKTIDDAATLAAHLHGFSSWHDYESLHDKEYKFKIQEEFKIKVPKFKVKNIKKTDNFFNNIVVNKPLKEFELKRSNILPSEWLIGKRKNIASKIEEPIGINSENYIVSGNHYKNIDMLLDSQIEWLLKYNQCFILFNMDLKQNNLLEKIQEKEIKIIGKNYSKFDPLEESFDGDGFESLMGISLSGESYTFPWVWSMLVRTIRDELNFKWSSEDLLESLKIENLIEITERLKNINIMVAKPLEHYLFKQCGIKLENDIYFLSEISQERHHHHIYLLKEKLQKIDRLYQLGVFSSIAKTNIKKHIFEKKSLVFLDCDEIELRDIYWEICNLTYINAIKSQNKLIKDFDENQYKVWSIWNEANHILDEKNTYEIINLKDSVILGLYVNSDIHNLEYAFEKINQIVFLKQVFKKYPQSWISRSLNQTEYWEENIWFNSFEALRTIKEYEAFIWQTNELFSPTGLESFDCKKIVLYIEKELK